MCHVQVEKGWITGYHCGDGKDGQITTAVYLILEWLPFGMLQTNKTLKINGGWTWPKG
jgi:hypothetical protein